ncbi:hypothetical protein UA08_01220 [Talaromyces atroroseus]|uniref:Rhodanese domain-containing protein n=1 Tax=Talaromyces atroroseus TaxID=1441469 RepID=A0A1Q5QB44_TALAT|nr:hypothetical protein UA08_01220 [Talaromyces atroroseus]OKL63101.1 hypothetical protein UA08_01220 [Talaromyces atroroseus]
MTLTALRSSLRPCLLARLSRQQAASMASTSQLQQQRWSSFSSYLVTPQELNNALQKDSSGEKAKVVPLCAAWFMPNDPEGRTGIAAFRKSHIPHARFFDIDGVKDGDSPYPHMLPTQERFAEAMSELGIQREDEVVVYDTLEQGILSAPRVGWTLRFFGHPRVHVLNNYRLWVEQGLPTESGDAKPVTKTTYPIPSYETDRVVHFPEMKQIAGKEGAGEFEILDARPYGRWSGEAPEPRAGLLSGHMPGSKSVPFGELLDPTTKAFLSPEELHKVFEAKGVDPSKTIITSCGSGVTAAVIEAGLTVAGFGEPSRRRLYDGSWTEWAQRVDEASGLIKKL